MRIALFIALLFLTNAVIAQVPDSYDFKGQVKKVTITHHKDNQLTRQCEICDFYKAFDKKGNLLEESHYDVIEPVDDLSMGYCAQYIYKYNKKNEHISTQVKLTQKHGLDESQDDQQFKTIFEKQIKGDTTKILMQQPYWGSVKHITRINGKVIWENNGHKVVSYRYNSAGQLTDEISARGTRDTIRNHWEYNKRNQCIKRTYSSESWVQKEGTNETSMNHRYQSESEVFYYDNDTIYREVEYQFKKQKTGLPVRLMRLEKYYGTHGLDSVHRSFNQYKDPVQIRETNYRYTFHNNGQVATQESNSGGKWVLTHQYSSEGKLLRRTFYNVKSEPYEDREYTYSENGLLLLQKVVINNHGKETSSTTYKYDQKGNMIERIEHSTEGELKTVFEYEYY